MQTISVRYRCDAEGAGLIRLIRRIFSAGVRIAYANARDEQGISLKQKDLRDLVKSRLAGAEADAWVLHCATLEGMDLRKARPDGRMIFGGRSELRRRQKGLIGRDEWREARLRPFTSRGDKTFQGNRHFRLSEDAQHLHVPDVRAHCHAAAGRPKRQRRDNPASGRPAGSRQGDQRHVPHRC